MLYYMCLEFKFKLYFIKILGANHVFIDKVNELVMTIKCFKPSFVKMSSGVSSVNNLIKNVEDCVNYESILKNNMWIAGLSYFTY